MGSSIKKCEISVLFPASSLIRKPPAALAITLFSTFITKNPQARGYKISLSKTSLMLKK